MILTAKAHFKDTDNLINAIEDDVEYYLNKKNPSIFELKEKRNKEANSAYYQQYLDFIARNNKQQQTEEENKDK